MTSYFSASTEVDERELLATAPDLTIGANRVRLDGACTASRSICRRETGAVARDGRRSR